VRQLIYNLRTMGFLATIRCFWIDLWYEQENEEEVKWAKDAKKNWEP